jgi:hypothetical protein
MARGRMLTAKHGRQGLLGDMASDRRVIYVELDCSNRVDRGKSIGLINNIWGTSCLDIW